LITIFFSACRKDEIKIENRTEISADIIQKLMAAGFDTSEDNNNYLISYNNFLIVNLYL